MSVEPSSPYLRAILTELNFSYNFVSLGLHGVDNRNRITGFDARPNDRFWIHISA